MEKTPFEQQIAQLKAQHPGCSLHHISFDNGVELVMRSMTPTEWAHLDGLAEDKRPYYMDQYAQKCTLLVMEPEGTDLSALLQEMPGFINPIGQQLMQITGALTKAVAKKL